jgi:hypothetical protein
MISNTKQIDCPKCDGRGHIEGFGHVANGVCFCCKGNRTLTIDLDAQRAKLGPDRIKQAEWVMASTEESYSRMSYGKLLKIRDFCHGGWGLQYAYPAIHAHWFAVGEWAFQAAQEERLAGLYANRN